MSFSRPPKDINEAYEWGVRDTCHSMRMGALRGAPLDWAKKFSQTVDEVEQTLLSFLRRAHNIDER